LWLENCNSFTEASICMNITIMIGTFYLGSKVINLVKCSGLRVIILVALVNLTLIQNTVVLILYSLQYQNKIEENRNLAFNWGPFIAVYELLFQISSLITLFSWTYYLIIIRDYISDCNKSNSTFQSTDHTIKYMYRALHTFTFVTLVMLVVNCVLKSIHMVQLDEVDDQYKRMPFYMAFEGSIEIIFGALLFIVGVLINVTLKSHLSGFYKLYSSKIWLTTICLSVS
jgi:hypothetical protein